MNDQTIKTKLKDSFIYNVSKTKLQSAGEMTYISLIIRGKAFFSKNENNLIPL